MSIVAHSDQMELQEAELESFSPLSRPLPFKPALIPFVAQDGGLSSVVGDRPNESTLYKSCYCPFFVAVADLVFASDFHALV